MNLKKVVFVLKGRKKPFLYGEKNGYE